MKLVNTKYNIAILFEENNTQVLVVENHYALQQMLSELWRQAEGGDGDWILSDGTKEYALSRKAENIFNVFSLEINNRKVIGKLYQEIEHRINETCTEDAAKIDAEVVRLLDRISTDLPYTLSYSLDLDIQGLLKLYNVVLDEYEMDLLEKLCTYIRNLHQLCRTEIFVFLNLKQLISEEQLLELYKFCYYEKVFILDVESSCLPRVETEKYTILDKDLCLISY